MAKSSPAGKGVRLKDIAMAAGVTSATVSLALRNHPRISAERCKEIQSLAKKLGYQVDAKLGELMSHLRKGKPAVLSDTIALLTGYDTPDQWRQMSSIRNFVKGAKAQANALGYRLEPIWAGDPELSPRRLEQILLARGIRGVLVLRLPDGYPAEEIDWSHFCPVRQIDAVELPKMRMARGNQFEHARRVATQMVDRGYQRCALLMQASHSSLIKRDWRFGFWSVMAETRTKHRILEIQHTRSDRSSNSLADWRPDAIAASVTHLARAWLSQHPDAGHCGYVSLNIENRDRKTSGILTRHDLVGSQAISMIVGQINRNQPGLSEMPQQVLFEGEWQEGTTLPDLST